MALYKVVLVQSSDIKRGYNIPGANNEIELLETKVNKLIEEGWSCIGNVSYVCVEGMNNIYHQTMTKIHIKLDEQTKQNQELVSKLEEQIKLNGELCKRLFELKN
jgi:hypothetical protein